MSAEFVSFNDVCAELSLTERQLKRFISEGEIRAFREGDELRFRSSDVEFLGMRILEEAEVEELKKLMTIDNELATSDALQSNDEPAFLESENDYIDEEVDEYEEETLPKKITINLKIREEDMEKIQTALRKFDRSTIVKDILNAIILGLAFVAGMFFAKM